MGIVRPMLLFFASCAVVACARSTPPCTAGAVCGEGGSCIDGTCSTSPQLPARGATRVVVKPSAWAFVERGRSSHDAIAELGSGGKLLLRFSVTLEDVDRLVAAHVVLTRVSDDLPAPGSGAEGLVLRALRIVDPWDATMVTWANQPRTFDVGLPPLRVHDARVDRLRVDVREIVKRWPRRDAADQGIAVTTEGASALAVALTTLSPDVFGADRPIRGPELELYFAPLTREDPAPSPVQRVAERAGAVTSLE